MKTLRTALLLLLCFAPVAQADGLLDRLSGSKQTEYLDADKAFGVEIEVRDAHTLVAGFKVAPQYYLYRDKVAFSTADLGVKIAKVNLPKGEMKHDDNFGDLEVFHQPFQAEIVLERSSKAARSIKLQATYQGCSEQGLCYAPISKTLNIDLPAISGEAAALPAPAATASTQAAPEATPQASPPPVDNDNSRIARLFKQGSFWVIVSVFFGFGLALAFTPCMYPMVPILSGIIVGRGEKITHLHGFILSLSYVLGMALIYAALGVVAGYSGNLLSTALQTPWVLGASAAVFVLFALSMFGFYELQLPSSLQSRLTGASNRLHGGHITGVFVMGALAALIVSPCVSAPMGGAVFYLAQTHDALLGGSALFFMGLGMGLPLLVIGASAGTLLPKAGAWMEAIKRFFGVLFLWLAIEIIAPVIPVGVEMLLRAALLIVAAVYLHALDALPHNASGWQKLWKGVGVLVLLVGIAFLIGALSGARDTLHPLGAMGSARAEASTVLPFARVKTTAELDARVSQAGGRIVMLDFYADSCKSCKEMERDTFTDARVQAKLQNALLLRADVTAYDADDMALLHRFQLLGPPGILFFDRQGREQPEFRVIGGQNVPQFLESLKNAGL